MDQPQPSDADQATPLVGGRYEIVAQQGESVTARDHQPWRRCWACGATANEAGELFCTECGAALEGRSYRGHLASGEPAGVALVSAVKSEQAREMLPPIWDQVQDGERTLTLLADTGRAALAPPIEELDALHVGRGWHACWMRLAPRATPLASSSPPISS